MISLLYCGNEKVFSGLLISLLSVASYTCEPLDVHVLTMDLQQIDPAYRSLSEAQTAYLEEVLKKKNPENRVTRHDAAAPFLRDMKESPNLCSVYTPYTFLRLFGDELPLPDKVLYLDADTVAAGDVAPLYRTELDGYDFAGALDYLGRVFIHPKYINAGVLLMNLAQMRRSGFLCQARRLCAEKKMPFPDQDAMNRLEKHKYFLPSRFNEQHKMRPDTVIRHFSKTIRWLPIFHTVNIKPWQIEELHRVYHTYEFDDVLAEYTACLAAWQRRQKEGATV